MDKNIPQTPETVAYQLMKDIFAAEKKIEKSSDIIQDYHKIQKEDIISTYRECLELVKITQK